jgi:hypothetical protein
MIDLALANYRVIGSDAEGWHDLDDLDFSHGEARSGQIDIALPARFTRVELLIDRRIDMMQVRP